MKLEQSFTVEAPVPVVWEALIDVERVAPCLPGAEITGHDDEGAFHGQFTVKLGPTTAAYRGTLKMEGIDEGAHTATMKAHGSDKRGQGGANATIVSRLVEDGGGTRVDVETDFTITGRLARFGRGGMIEDVSRRLMKDFAKCLQATIAAEHEAASEPAAAGEAAGVGEAAGAGEAAGVGEAAAPASTPGAGAAAPRAPGQSVPPPARPRPVAPPAKPVHGFRLLLAVLWDRIRRLLGRR